MRAAPAELSTGVGGLCSPALWGSQLSLVWMSSRGEKNWALAEGLAAHLGGHCGPGCRRRRSHSDQAALGS